MTNQYDPTKMTKNKSSMMANFTNCASKVFGPNSVRRVPENPTTIAIEPVISNVFMIMAPSPSLPTRPLELCTHLLPYREHDATLTSQGRTSRNAGTETLRD